MKGPLLYFAAVSAWLSRISQRNTALDLGMCGPPGTRTLNLRIKSPQLCH
jgi:hypothetical protein